MSLKLLKKQKNIKKKPPNKFGRSPKPQQPSHRLFPKPPRGGGPGRGGPPKKKIHNPPPHIFLQVL